MAQRLQCRFFLLRYAPDAVKNEFVNIGVVLLPPAGSAEIRFTRDWSRVRCLDPQADIEVLEALEADLREKLREMNGDHEFILRRIQDSFSNALQPTEFQGCLAESPAQEADELARLYLERSRQRQPRELSARRAIYRRMQREFASAGVWPLMWRNVPVERYTRSGDPLEIDCGYSPNGAIKLFHAVSLATDVNSAKILAFTFPQLREGIGKAEGKEALLTAVVEDDLPADDEAASFARETLQQSAIVIATAAEMPEIAAQAARELGLR